MKRQLQRLATFALACVLMAPISASAAPKLRLKLKKSKASCVKKGKADCSKTRSSLNRACFVSLDHSLVKVNNDTKKCKDKRNAAKARCVRAAFLCKRSNSGAKCAKKLKKCNKKVERRFTKCTKGVNKYRTTSRNSFNKCSNGAKKQYRTCMFRVRRSCKLKKALRKNVIRR